MKKIISEKTKTKKLKCKICQAEYLPNHIQTHFTYSSQDKDYYKREQKEELETKRHFQNG